MSGPLSAHTDSTSYVLDVIAAHDSDSTDLTRFWGIESLGISSDEVEDRDAAMRLRHYQKQHIIYRRKVQSKATVETNTPTASDQL
ncbi:hypothetical protein DPMN_070169 [Dreissena polymorpha]|uniref:Uncharacterized protein n=1 Tax=Dreissena polymorpha TaxID=45954 RepID=A0A9D3Z0A6_DREPO|nr:hypothetical protein DPMN_070169 [Dreissena polymorpha]